jgi:hypothetical protein
LSLARKDWYLKNDEVGHPKAEVVRSSHFPFLDMKMTWSEEVDLRFGVYLKLGQELKCLTVTAHTPLSASKRL